MGSSSWTRDWTLGPQHWKHRVLATGPPRKSLPCFFWTPSAPGLCTGCLLFLEQSSSRDDQAWFFLVIQTRFSSNASLQKQSLHPPHWCHLCPKSHSLTSPWVIFFHSTYTEIKIINWFTCFFFLTSPSSMQDLRFPDQGLNPCPLQWKHRALTTGPPGKSLIHLFITSPIRMSAPQPGILPALFAVLYPHVVSV